MSLFPPADFVAVPMSRENSCCSTHRALSTMQALSHVLKKIKEKAKICKKLPWYLVHYHTILNIEK